MTTYWACPDLPSTGTESRCCFANSTCAEYICGHFGANITQQTTNSLVMHNCLVPNGTLATELYMNPPANGTCSVNTRGNGCIVRLDTNQTVTQTASGTSSAASTSSPASASASASASGSTSNALPQIGGLNQSLLLGIVGITWLIKRICH